jgi:hypothetical protein
MLGNDTYGDCVFAGAAHETMMWMGEHYGSPTRGFRDEDVLADYGAVTGFTPGNPSSDQGAVVLDALNYRRHVGIRDEKGARHKLGAYVELEPGNWDEVKLALYLGHAVGVGIEFPDSAMEQFNAGQPWRSVAGARIEGGHYIPIVGVVHKRILVVTWGRTQSMSLEFFRRYCDEAYALLSPEMIRNGHSSEGFDYDALNAALAALG